MAEATNNIAVAAALTTTRPFKVIAGADSFGANLKDVVVSHLLSLNIEVEDLGVSSYYSAGADVGRQVSAATADPSSGPEIRGLVCCGTGVGVSIFANKFPGVYAATCLSAADAINARSINNSNVLALSGMSTPPESAIQIVNAWLNTSFKSPCPASGSNPWSPEICSFLDTSLAEIPKIGKQNNQKTLDESSSACAICCLAKNREFTPVDIMPGGSMKIVRESPTSAIVKFKAGSIEPAHHHSFGHDVMVLTGNKSVWNLKKNARYDLVNGDYLYTPAGDVHRVKYHEDTEFFITWDGQWGIFLDEDLEAAKKALDENSANGLV